MSKFCAKCGTALEENSRFCMKCGTAVQQPDGISPGNVNVFNGSAFDTAAAATGHPKAASGIADIFVGSFANVIKSPKTLITIGVVSAAQIVVPLLAKTDINTGLYKFFAWITFCNGALGRSIPGALCGIVGRGVFAAAVAALVNGGFKNVITGIKNVFGAKPKNLTALVFGIGAAMLAFNIFAGSTDITKTFGGVAMLFLILNIIGKGSGRLYDLASSLAPQKNTQWIMTGFLTGASAGSVIAVFISAFLSGFVPAAVGLLLIIAGVLVAVFTTDPKGGASL